MFKRIADSGSITQGADFYKFANNLQTYVAGLVTNITDESIDVDFGDYVMRWKRDTVGQYIAMEGGYMEFFSSPKAGELVENYR